jgi:hypothetical protein
MIQIRAGDFVAVLHEDTWVSFAVLGKQILFGGHWCFAYYAVQPQVPSSDFVLTGTGFNVFINFIVPKRDERLGRISRGNDFSALKGPELLVQQPVKGEVNYEIWRWKSRRREEAEYVRFTPAPSQEERCSPEYACFPADLVCELVKREWKLGDRWWVA